MDEEATKLTSAYWQQFEATGLGDAVKETAKLKDLGFWDAAEEVFKNLAELPNVLADIDSWSEDRILNGFGLMLRGLKVPGNVIEQVKDAVRRASPDVFPLRGLTAIWVTLWGMIDYLKAFNAVVDPFITYAFNENFTPQRIDLTNLIQYAWRHTGRPLTGDLAGYLGLGDDEIEKLNIATQAYYDLQSLYDLFRRGEISEATLEDHMRRIGFHDAAVRNNFKKLAYIPIQGNDAIKLYFRGLLNKADTLAAIQAMGLKREDAERMISGSVPLLTPGVFVNATIRNTKGKELAEGDLRKQGFDQSRIDALLESSKTPASPDVLTRAYWRGVIDEYEYEYHLSRLGFDDEAIQHIKKTVDVLPTPQDLVRFGVREVFNPAITKAWGHFTEFPTDIVEWGKKIGMSEEVLKMYWAAHWDLPSPEQGFDMYHRGIIDREELASLLKALDVLPGWRDRMIELSDRLIPRRSLPKMYAYKLFSYDDLRTRFFKLGYSEEDADIMAKQAALDATEEPREATKGDIISAFIAGFIDRDTAEEMLRKLSYANDVITFLLDFAETKRKLQEEADEKSDVDRIEKHIKEDIRDTVLDLYEEGKLNEEEAKDELAGLGYPADYSSVFIRYREVLRERKLTQHKAEQIEKLYKNGAITREEATAELTKAGYNPNATALKVNQWALEKQVDESIERTRVSHPPRTDVLRWFKTGIIDADEFVARMRDLRYDDKAIVNYMTEIMSEFID